jgi:hypothetical protein
MGQYGFGYGGFEPPYAFYELGYGGIEPPYAALF